MLTSSINSSYFLPKFNVHNFGSAHLQGESSGSSPEALNRSKVSPQQLVDLHVIDKLEKALNIEKLSLKGLETEDFSPQAVADRILTSVKQAFGRFQQSQPERDRDEFFSQVRDGLEKGFAEAKDMLDNLGVLQGQIAANVDKTYDLTLQGLDDLQSGSSETAAVSSAAFEVAAMRTSRSGQIQIETREGDIIKIGFSQSASFSQSAASFSQPGFSLNAFEQSASFSQELSISIEGDLNTDEQKALKSLMQDMHKISNAFFHGNDKAALHHAMKLGLDGEQIAGFSMDLTARKSVQAVTAYQQTALPEQTVDGGLLSQAGDFLAQAKTMLSDVRGALQAMADPQKAFNDLFAGIGMLSNESPDQAGDSGDIQGFNQLINLLSRNLLSDGASRQAA